MNLKNLEELRQWLLAGAPHVVFSMDIGVEEFGDLPDEELDKISTIELNKPGIGDCSTVCCIAGRAALSSGLSADEAFYWWRCRDAALRWLGLPKTERIESEESEDSDDLDERGQNFWDSHFGHELFDFNLAPKQCTPQQAAQAVLNVMEGRRPWDGITDEVSG